MKNLKFFTLLSALTEKELSEFSKYLKQQHGKEAVALKVFDYFRKYRSGIEADKKPDMAYVYRKIFHEEISANEGNRKNMLNAFSDLHLWLKDFLLTAKACGDSFESQVLWLQILQEKGLEDSFSKEAERFFKETKADRQKGINGYLREATASYFFYRNLIQGGAKPEVDTFQQCLNAIQVCSETIQLKMAAEIANLEKLLPQEPAPKPLKKPQKKDIDSAVLPLLYKEALQLVNMPEEIHFTALNKMLVNNVDALEPQELHQVLRYLYNFVAIQNRNGNLAAFAEALHRLNIFALDHDFFAQKNEMTATGFTNIVNVACAQQDYTWVTKFISDKNSLLPEDVRAETVAISNALVSFEKKQFAQTLEQLESTLFKDFNYVIRAKSLVLRSLYEIDADPDEMADYCNTFEAMLRRKRKSRTAVVDSLLRFTSIFKMLLQQKIEKEALHDLINASPNLFFREWLLAKLDNYDDRHRPGKGSR